MFGRMRYPSTRYKSASRSTAVHGYGHSRPRLIGGIPWTQQQLRRSPKLGGARPCPGLLNLVGPLPQSLLFTHSRARLVWEELCCWINWYIPPPPPHHDLPATSEYGELPALDVRFQAFKYCQEAESLRELCCWPRRQN